MSPLPDLEAIGAGRARLCRFATDLALRGHAAPAAVLAYNAQDPPAAVCELLAGDGRIGFEWDADKPNMVLVVRTFPDGTEDRMFVLRPGTAAP